MLTIEATNANGNAAGNGIDSQKTSGTNTISAKVGLASSQTWTVATGGTLAVSGAISDFGAGTSLTKAGGGTLTLTGANTYSGGNIITGGILSVNATAAASVANGPLAISNGGRLIVASTNITSSSQVTIGTGAEPSPLTEQQFHHHGQTHRFRNAHQASCHWLWYSDAQLQCHR